MRVSTPRMYPQSRYFLVTNKFQDNDYFCTGTNGSGASNDYLAEVIEDEKNKPWHWSRKCKVFILTSLCIGLTFILLFLPEAVSNMNLVTVEQNVDYVQA